MRPLALLFGVVLAAPALAQTDEPHVFAPTFDASNAAAVSSELVERFEWGLERAVTIQIVSRKHYPSGPVGGIPGPPRIVSCGESCIDAAPAFRPLFEVSGEALGIDCQGLLGFFAFRLLNGEGVVQGYLYVSGDQQAIFVMDGRCYQSRHAITVTRGDNVPLSQLVTVF